MSASQPMPSAAAHYYSRSVSSVRSVFRSSEAAIILLAVGVGLAAGLFTIGLHGLAHGMQRAIYKLDSDSLSASSVIDPWRLVALPIGGLVLGFGSRSALRRHCSRRRRSRPPITCSLPRAASSAR